MRHDPVDLCPDLRDHHLPEQLAGPAHRHPHHNLHHRRRQCARQIYSPLAQAVSRRLAKIANQAAPRRCQKVQVGFLHTQTST